MIESKHINATHTKLTKLVRWEIFPMLMLSGCALIYFKYQTEFLNLLPKSFEAITTKDERMVARKLSSLLKYQFLIGNEIDSDLLDVELLESIYGFTMKYL
jgi:uncharacterized protein YdhG (YjbR/CyaY superfamily)